LPRNSRQYHHNHNSTIPWPTGPRRVLHCHPRPEDTWIWLFADAERPVMRRSLRRNYYSRDIMALRISPRAMNDERCRSSLSRESISRGRERERERQRQREISVFYQPEWTLSFGRVYEFSLAAVRSECGIFGSPARPKSEAIALDSRPFLSVCVCVCACVCATTSARQGCRRERTVLACSASCFLQSDFLSLDTPLQSVTFSRP